MRLCYICVLVIVFFIHGASLDRFSSCKTPTLRFGRIRSRQRGRSIRFICNPSYQLAGERTAFCINGSWNMPIPKCVRNSCTKKEAAPVNGLTIPGQGGAVLNFYCRQGFELNGPASVYCDGFTWDGHRPSCIPANTKPKLFCDFEDPDLCHWTHDLNHDMDWVRDSYKTPTGYSMDTGPSFDHTRGNGSNGHFMYIESSSRRINDTARLISPIFGKINGSLCLEFWYHMYGKTTGTLKAYVKKLSDLWPLNPAAALFSKSGNQGNVWYRAFVDLGHVPEDFQIIMEGVRGNGYVSDIAIDDIKIIPNCVYEEHIQSTTESIQLGSEILKTVESCDNRCGQKAIIGTESAQLIACDCDELCYETSRCCPDYIDMCLGLSTTEWSTTPEGYASVTEELIVVPRSNASAKSITIPTTLRSTIAAFSPTTKRTSSPLTPKTTTTKKSVIPQRVNTIPTLIFLQSTTIRQVVQKIVPKLPPNKDTSKIIFVKPKGPTTNSAYNDDIEVPAKADNDEELLLSSPLPIDEDSNDINDVSVQEREDYVEKITNEKYFPVKMSDINPEEIKTEFSQVQEEHSSTKLIFVVLAAICGFAVLGIIAGVVLVKFRFVPFRNRRINSGQGDSQSDVRFLTADEVLDFNLDKDYDEL